MHDPLTVAFEIRSPFRDKPSQLCPKGYRPSLVTIWHCDPERDGSDDSCGWFIRGRHLSKADKDLAHRLITQEGDNLRHWFKARDDDEAIGQCLGVIAALRRRERPWWRHPKWHVWHWRFQVHPWQAFRRWLLTRCALCGKRFPYGYSPVSHSWGSQPPKFMRGEVGLYHSECSCIVVESHKATRQ